MDCRSVIGWVVFALSSTGVWGQSAEGERAREAGDARAEMREIDRQLGELRRGLVQSAGMKELHEAIRRAEAKYREGVSTDERLAGARAAVAAAEEGVKRATQEVIRSDASVARASARLEEVKAAIVRLQEEQKQLEGQVRSATAAAGSSAAVKAARAQVGEARRNLEQAASETLVELRAGIEAARQAYDGALRQRYENDPIVRDLLVRRAELAGKGEAVGKQGDGSE